MLYADNSLSSRVFIAIENKILSGEYKIGDSIIETKIGEELGVSRTPIRVALSKLESAGLVNIIPNKGAIVVGISEKDIDDIFEIRKNIEGIAARWAAENITDNELSQLKESVDLLEFYANRNDVESVNKTDSTFHEIIYSASKSKILAQILFNFHHYIKGVRVKSFKVSSRLELVVIEHRKILDAIEAHNGSLAEKLATEHVENAANNIKAYRGDK